MIAQAANGEGVSRRIGAGPEMRPSDNRRSNESEAPNTQWVVMGRADLVLEKPESTRAASDEAVLRLLAECLPKARITAALIMRNPCDGDDAVQEAALVAWQKRRDLRDSHAAEAWFRRILVNVCRAHLRRSARRPVVAWSSGTDDIAVDDNVERASTSDEIAQAVATLKPDEQVILALRYGQDLTVPQIAQAAGLREGTVKSRLHAAHEHLRARMDATARLEESGR